METAKKWNGDRLRQFRLRRGLSQDGLALLVGTSQRNIFRYEHNKNQPRANMVARLAHGLEVDEGDFFSNGSDDEEEESELVGGPSQIF